MVDNRTPTEARQASPRKTNFRVLIVSTILTALILGGFVIAFYYATPTPVPPAAVPSTVTPQNGSAPQP